MITRIKKRIARIDFLNENYFSIGSIRVIRSNSCNKSKHEKFFTSPYNCSPVIFLQPVWKEK